MNNIGPIDDIGHDDRKKVADATLSLSSLRVPFSSSVLEGYMVEDTWLLVLDYLELADVYSLLSTSKTISVIVDSEKAYERRARSTYPTSTLQPHNLCKYNEQIDGQKTGNNHMNSVNVNNDDRTSHHVEEKPCWKELVRDFNGKNGFYVRRIDNRVSNWTSNGAHWSYVNSIRYMIWDRREKSISLIAENFGYDDIGVNLTTSVFRLTNNNKNEDCDSLTTATRIYPIRTETLEQEACSGITRILPGSGEELFFQNKHRLCKIVFAEDAFSHSNCTYKFTFDGDPKSKGGGYGCTTFLYPSEVQSLKGLFNTTVDADSSSICQFVQREDSSSSWWLKPSNVLDWPNVNLPPFIRRHWENSTSRPNPN